MTARNDGDERLGEVVRLLRERQHLGLRTLAERTGFSASFLSQVENGQASPSIASLQRIATALGVTLAEFFATTAAEPTAPVVRVASRRGLTSEWSRARIEALAAPRRRARLHPLLVTLDPGGQSGRGVRPAENEEFALVLEGEVVLTLGTAEHTLVSGDAATIPAGTPRQWANTADRVTRIVIVEALVQGSTGPSAAADRAAVPDRTEQPGR